MLAGYKLAYVGIWGAVDTNPVAGYESYPRHLDQQGSRTNCRNMGPPRRPNQGVKLRGSLLAASNDQHMAVELGCPDMNFLQGSGWGGGSHAEFGHESRYCRWSLSWFLVGVLPLPAST
jgi:hypothetical protein